MRTLGQNPDNPDHWYQNPDNPDNWSNEPFTKVEPVEAVSTTPKDELVRFAYIPIGRRFYRGTHGTVIFTKVDENHAMPEGGEEYQIELGLYDRCSLLQTTGDQGLGFHAPLYGQPEGALTPPIAKVSTPLPQQGFSHAWGEPRDDGHEVETDEFKIAANRVKMKHANETYSALPQQLPCHLHNGLIFCPHNKMAFRGCTECGPDIPCIPMPDINGSGLGARALPQQEEPAKTSSELLEAIKAAWASDQVTFPPRIRERLRKAMAKAESEPIAPLLEQEEPLQTLATVFSRPECVFMYCPHPEQCQSACQSPRGCSESNSLS